LSVIILALIVTWILSFLGTVVRYYGFELRIFKDELNVKAGLFTPRQSTVPFNRIQWMRIKEELIRQTFGLRKLTIESVDYGEQNKNATTLFPIIQKEEIPSFLNEVLPEFNVSVENVSPPTRSLRRYILHLLWPLFVVIIPLFLWVPYGIFSPLLVVPAIILGYAQYKDAKVGVNDETLVVQSRMVGRRIAIVKRWRIQAVKNKQNPFQRRLNLASFYITIASGSKGRTFTVRELDEKTASSFFN